VEPTRRWLAGFRLTVGVAVAKPGARRTCRPQSERDANPELAAIGRRMVLTDLAGERGGADHARYAYDRAVDKRAVSSPIHR